VQVISLDLFLGYFKGRCHGNQFVEKTVPSFVTLAFRNEIGYRYLNVRITS